MKKEDLRPIYSELQGYLSQAPTAEKIYDHINDSNFWTTINITIDDITKITGEDYNKFKLIPKADAIGGKFIIIHIYRQKLAGLITYIHAKYFNDEPSPLAKDVPNTFISQNQSVNVQILLDIQSKIDEKIKNYSDDSKENKFLKKLKGCLSATTNIIQLINHIMKIAKDFGLNLSDLSGIFS